MFKTAVGLIVGLIVGYFGASIAADTTRKYACPEAIWAGRIEVVPTDESQKFVGELGFCPDGLVLWRK